VVVRARVLCRFMMFLPLLFKLGFPR